MTQDELKQLVGQAAADYVNANVPEGSVIGVGTGSTANCFIDALAASKTRYRGAVSSSLATTARLQAHGFKVLDLNEIDSLPVYVDGADEIDHGGAMIKGGGGALTREKIVASVSDVFVCIADASKLVDTLGNFPLPIEVVPMARTAIGRRVTALGGVLSTLVRRPFRSRRPLPPRRSRPARPPARRRSTHPRRCPPPRPTQQQARAGDRREGRRDLQLGIVTPARPLERVGPMVVEDIFALAVALEVSGRDRRRQGARAGPSIHWASVVMLEGPS